MPSGLSLGVRVAGDWTAALNRYTNEMVDAMEGSIRSDGATIEVSEKCVEGNPLEVPVQVLIDGPYGGSSVDLGDYETVLLFSGGSGITFTLGLLDDIVGRCIRKGRKNGEKTKRIEFSWCIRSFGEYRCSMFIQLLMPIPYIGQIDCFSSALMDIATIVASSATSATPLYLHISIYVTCLCNPDAIPPIPNCDVIVFRPSAYQILRDLINGPKDDVGAGGADSVPNPENNKSNSSPPSTEIIVIDEEESIPSVSQKLPWIKPGGGMAVCASGPAILTCETANAVSRVQLSKKGRELGMIGLHTEVFAL
jgi:ferric-chelate reductase